MKASQVAGTPERAGESESDGKHEGRTEDCKGEPEDPEGEGKHCFPPGETFYKGRLKEREKRTPGCDLTSSNHRHQVQLSSTLRSITDLRIPISHLLNHSPSDSPIIPLPPSILPPTTPLSTTRPRFLNA